MKDKLIGFIFGIIVATGAAAFPYAWDLHNSPNENLNRAEAEQNQEEMLEQQREQTSIMEQQRKPC